MSNYHCVDCGTELPPVTHYRHCSCPTCRTIGAIKGKHSAESFNGGDMPWPATVAIIGLFVWFLSWGHWSVAKIIWKIFKIGIWFMGGFFFMDSPI